MMAAKRTTNFVACSLSALFLAGLGVGLFHDGDRFDLAQRAPTLWIALTAGVVAVSLAIGTVWMRGVDELAQRAHYVAWCWGGSFGLCVVMFLFLAAPAIAELVSFGALLEPATRAWGEAGPFMAGMLTAVVALSLGYGLWWGAYWLRKR